MYKFILFAVMVTLMATPSASLGKTLRDAVGICPDGTERRTQVECEPGMQVVVQMTCAGQRATFRVGCPEEPEPERIVEYWRPPLRAFLVLDVGLSAGAIGFGGHTTGIGLLHLGLELRPRQDVGFLAEGRVGISGEFQQEQTRKFSSYFGGAAYFTWRPADFVRLAFGLSGFTARASTWKNVLSGVAGSMRLDFTVGGEWRLGLIGDIGSGWSPCSQKVYWMGLFGVSYGAPVVNLEDK